MSAATKPVDEVTRQRHMAICKPVLSYLLVKYGGFTKAVAEAAAKELNSTPSKNGWRGKYRGSLPYAEAVRKVTKSTAPPGREVLICTGHAPFNSVAYWKAHYDSLHGETPSPAVSSEPSAMTPSQLFNHMLPYAREYKRRTKRIPVFTTNDLLGGER